MDKRNLALLFIAILAVAFIFAPGGELFGGRDGDMVTQLTITISDANGPITMYTASSNETGLIPQTIVVQTPAGEKIPVTSTLYIDVTMAYTMQYTWDAPPPQQGDLKVTYKATGDLVQLKGKPEISGSVQKWVIGTSGQKQETTLGAYLTSIWSDELNAAASGLALGQSKSFTMKLESTAELTSQGAPIAKAANTAQCTITLANSPTGTLSFVSVQVYFMPSWGAGTP